MSPKAMLSLAPGGPDTLCLTEIPLPRPGPGAVRIAVKAAAVNFPDTLIIEDKYQFKPDRPFAPGGEIAGVIEALGDGVSGLSVGDRVLAVTVHGGFATHCAVPAADVTRIPDNMPFDEASCLLITYGTSYHALADRGALKPGDTLLVMGAAGGIGVSAVELGLALGARVIAAVSSEEKAAFCRKLGAHEVLIYPREMDKDAQRAFADAIKAAAGPDGVTVAYDPVGGDYAEPALRAMGWRGRYLVIGFPAGIPKIPLNLALLKGCDIVGVFWGAFAKREPRAFAAQVQALIDLHAAGRIRPRISARYPLADAAKALQVVAARKAIGKIVLTMD